MSPTPSPTSPCSSPSPWSGTLHTLPRRAGTIHFPPQNTPISLKPLGPYGSSSPRTPYAHSVPHDRMYISMLTLTPQPFSSQSPCLHSCPHPPKPIDLRATLGLSNGPFPYLSSNPMHHGFLQLVLVLVTRKLFKHLCLPLGFRNESLRLCF